MHPRHVNKQTRKIIEKTRDLTRGKKVRRIYNARVDGTYAIVRCLQTLKEYLSCTFAEIDDKQIHDQLSSTLGAIENLIGEIQGRAEDQKKLYKTIVLDALRSHGNLFNLALGKGVALSSCQDSLADLSLLYVAVWGNNHN